MAFNVVLYSGFSKRLNSTKQPTGGSTVSGVLKEDCSIRNPVIMIESSVNMASYNYAYIPTFQRYYYITDIVSTTGFWEVHMQSDSLATYRTQIGSLTAYVERCSNTFDGEIKDTLYPAKTNLSITHTPLTSSYYGIAPSGGCFVLGIINKSGSGQAGGAVTYYAMTPAQIKSLMSYLMSDAFMDDAGFPSIATAAQQLFQSTAKALVKPMDYITSCTWFPTVLTGTSTQVTLGFWDFGENTIYADKVSAFAYTESFSGTIPAHPQAATRGAFLTRAPYTSVSVHVQPFGIIPLDTAYIGATGAISGTIYVDVITGKAVCRVSIDGQVAGEASAMFGVPIQISQITPDMLGAITDTATGIASAYGRNATGLLSSIGNALNDITPTPRTLGVDGSFLSEIIPPLLVTRHALLVDENNTEFGRPLCANRMIDTIPGYIKCGEASADVPGFGPEKAEIQTHLLNGFFWE